MRRVIVEIGMVLFFLAGVPALSAAESAPLPVGGVTVTADDMSRDEVQDTLQARGNVQSRWSGYTLLSDTVLIRLADEQAFAEGKVVLRKEGMEFTTDRMTINYATQKGESGKGLLYIKQRNFSIRGERFFKTGPDDYRVERGTFTTCLGDAPSWKFTASDLDLTIDDYAVGRNAVFYVADMPLFYTPYILFPVMTERQSGFLFARIGSSSKKGLNLDIPYYWAISPSKEATFDLDLQTKRGAGLGIDYRYLRPNDSSGQFKSYIIYDTQKEWVRGDVVVKLQEALSPTFRLTSDLRLATDRDFYRDYGQVSGEYNRQLLDSTLFLTKNWSLGSLAVETRYVEDLNNKSNKQTQQKLPEITYTQTKSPIGTTPVYFGLDSSLGNFYREDGFRGQRLDLHPTLSYYRTFAPGLDFSVWGGYRQRFYTDYGASADKRFDPRGDGRFDGAAALSAPIARVYPLGGSDLLAVRHSLIPELRYSLAEQKSQENLPFFDFKDRIPGQQMLTWSLTNFVTGKYADASGSPVYRDIIYVKLSQGYQLSGNRRDQLTPVDEGRRFTDIRLESRYALAKNLTVNIDTRYNPYMTRLSTSSLRLDVDNGKGDLAGLGYQFVRNGVEYLEGKLALAFFKPVFLKYAFRYSFDRKNYLENDYSLEYRKQCWSILFSYQDRLANKQFVVSFTLAGIGTLGR